MSKCPGQTFNVSVNVSNASDACYTPAYAIYLENTGSHALTSAKTGTYAQICPGDDHVATYTVTVPGVAAGTYQVRFKVDPSNTIGEFIEGDNYSLENFFITVPGGC